MELINGVKILIKTVEVLKHELVTAAVSIMSYFRFFFKNCYFLLMYICTLISLIFVSEIQVNNGL